MKTIGLIETIDGLRLIKTYLSDINAEFSSFHSVDNLLDSGTKPDLLILQANSSISTFREDLRRLRLSADLSPIPRIVLAPREDIRIFAALDDIKDEIFVPTSTEKLRFLSILADLLEIPNRRVYQILVNINVTGSALKYSGVSVDFSVNGMAFECIAELPKGENIEVSFVDSRFKKRFLLRAEIVRRKPNASGTKVFYGVRFISLSEEDSNDLHRFIRGEEISTVAS